MRHKFNTLKSAIRSFVLAVLSCVAMCVHASSAASAFRVGVEAYGERDFPLAAKSFAEVSMIQPSSGALLNLGNAEWQLNHTAEAIVAWEQARCLDPLDGAAENNLKCARETAQLEAPDLTWCEIASTWLPAETWAWLACGSFWLAVGMMLVPDVLRCRKTAIQQAIVALGLGVFLLSLPANYGVWTRSRLGVVLQSETPLRLTPTAESEASTKLAAGEPGRVLRSRGKYLLIQTRRTVGWVQVEDFKLFTPK